MRMKERTGDVLNVKGIQHKTIFFILYDIFTAKNKTDLLQLVISRLVRTF